MTDYSKLTVVKLKDELKSRGLPVAGLKAVLVARLDEDDAAKATTQEETVEQSDAPQPEAEEALQPVLSALEAGHVKEIISKTQPRGASTDEMAPEIEEFEQDPQTQPSIDAVMKDTPTDLQTQELVAAEESNQKSSGEPEHSAPPPRQVEQDTSSREAPIQVPETQTQTGSVESTHPEWMAIPSAETQPMAGSQGVQSQPAVTATQTTVDPEEVMDDSRKRKRRSRSPAPLTQDIAMKKLKGEDGSPLVEPVEGMVEAKTSISDLMDVEPTGKPKIASPPPKADPGNEQDTASSPRKPSPVNARFKGLFAPVASKSSDDVTSKPALDRDIAPAQHPATSALYIRNLMRPLQPAALREHLTALAQPGGEVTEAEVIQEFYLDSIKSHSLTLFKDVAIASRVRSALHNVVWPNEKARKPLWVDYVPEAKVKQWIEVELDAAGARPPKRWEVVYEQGAGGTVAYLQETDSAQNGPAPSRSGPAPKMAAAPVPPVPKGDPGQGFKALDDLFRSTTAKPKLYFLPVVAKIAEARLGRLDAGRGGGRNDEMRRFTFEDEQLVDDGPEFRPGYRGPRGGGGGGGRGGGRGGGAFRGDSWRSRR